MTKKNGTTRGLATRTPLGVLLVTPKALKSILSTSGVTALGTLPNAPSVAHDAPTRKTAKATTSGARGRTPGAYFVKTGARLPKDVNENTATVFQFIKRNRKGISQSALVKGTKLPNSTVWYALKNLQNKLKAVQYKSAAA
jgi:hypothetical protein